MLIHLVMVPFTILKSDKTYLVKIAAQVPLMSINSKMLPSYLWATTISARLCTEKVGILTKLLGGLWSFWILRKLGILITANSAGHYALISQ